MIAMRMNLDSLVKAYYSVSNFIARDPYYSEEILATSLIGLGAIFYPNYRTEILATGLVGIGIDFYVKYWHPRLEKTEAEEIDNYRREKLERVMQKIAQEPGLKGLEPALIDLEGYVRTIKFLRGRSKRVIEGLGVSEGDMEYLRSMRRLYLKNIHNKPMKRLARKTFFTIAGKYLLVVDDKATVDVKTTTG